MPGKYFIRYCLTCFYTSLLSFFTAPVFAFTYGEHKTIGDQAFARFLKELAGYKMAPLFLNSLGIISDSLPESQYFSFLSPQGANLISYGILNGLSGDHENNPLQLKEALNNKNSVIQKIISLHQEYIKQGYTAAPDGELARVDFRYAWLAAMNTSHFYIYGKSFPDQLEDFDAGLIKKCQDAGAIKEVFKKLGRTNAITMYVTVHLLAIDLAERAGRLNYTDPEQAGELIRNAILFNSFADHFLEDAFSSGHLIVNRSPLASFTNNKALHDFYSAHRNIVTNKKGEVWKAYGDGQLQKSQPQRIIYAVELSIREVFDAWQESLDNPGHPSFLQHIPTEKQLQHTYLIRQLKPLAWVPIPYNTDLKLYFPDSVISTAQNKASQLLPQRNFLRSRIGNSFVVRLNSRTFSDHYFQGGDFRINFGLFKHQYEYNERGTKQGKLDIWNGYTISYSIGRTGIYQANEPQQEMHLVKGGLRSNFDYWVTDKKFIGFSDYLESGLQFSGDRTAVILVPSAGVQLGSLLNVNYYNMPTWLRIPAQLFLPLEVRIGSLLSPNNKHAFFSGFDLTYAF